MEREYFWFKKNRDAYCAISETLRRMDLTKFGEHHWMLPTFREMIVGLFTFSIFSRKNFGLMFFNSELRKGLSHTYYDGNHCSFNTGIIGFWWYY